MILDPHDLLILKDVLWPQDTFYKQQVEIIESTLTVPETHVAAGNQLGKDYVAAFLVVGCFVMCQVRDISCRILTTSVAEHHLKVLWGEVGQRIRTCRQPLLEQEGGSLVIHYQEIRRREERDLKNPTNYAIGRVSEKGEGLAGHHAEFTMLVGDEASGLADEVYKMAQGWAKHMLFIGNPNPCANFFRKSIKAGNLVAA